MSRCQNLTLRPEEWRVPETPSDKDRETHELTHLPTLLWCSVCVRAKGVDERHLHRPAGERAEAQGVDHMPVTQFGCASLSSVNEKGEQVRRMRTIWDISAGYGTACVIDVKSGRQVCNLFCGVVCERIGVHTISMQDGSRACDQRIGGCGHQVFCQLIAQSGKSCQKRIPRSMRVWVHWRAGTIFCKDKFERCDSTSKIDLGQSSVILISARRGL